MNAHLVFSFACTSSSVCFSPSHVMFQVSTYIIQSQVFTADLPPKQGEQFTVLLMLSFLFHVRLLLRNLWDQDALLIVFMKTRLNWIQYQCILEKLLVWSFGWLTILHCQFLWFPLSYGRDDILVNLQWHILQVPCRQLPLVSMSVNWNFLYALHVFGHWYWKALKCFVII